MAVEMKNILLAADIGNTNIVLGALRGREVLFEARIPTDASRDGAGYGQEMCAILHRFCVEPEQVEGCIIASVVPAVTEAVRAGLQQATGREPLVVHADMETGMQIRMDDVTKVGSDRIVIAVAALETYQPPMILMDLGTATTMEVVDSQRTYVGGCIIPGVRTALDALARNAAQLPQIELNRPAHTIGKNTVECMQSGIMYGTAAMLDGMVERMEEELGEETTVIATGGIAPSIVPLCRRKMILENDLMLQGLRVLYEKNH